MRFLLNPPRGLLPICGILVFLLFSPALVCDHSHHLDSFNIARDLGNRRCSPDSASNGGRGWNAAFQGQISLVCAGAPQIATCSIAPTTVVLPGDDVPKTVQFTVKTTVVSGASSATAATGFAGTFLWWAPLGVAAVSLRRRTARSRRGGLCLALLVLLTFAGCGGGHTGPYGNWTIVMTAANSGSGQKQYATLNLTIVP